jgi:hypothetical protein
MKKLISELLFFLLSMQAFGTAQIPDILIYKSDTLYLFDCPLDYFPDQGLINPKRLFGCSGCFYTACYRNYIATWKIEGNKLYLLNLKNTCYPSDMKYVNASFNSGADTLGKEYADLDSLFPDKFADGKVSADWVNCKIIAPKGKMLYYINDGFMSIFEKELEFTFEKGTLFELQEFDNSKTRISKYTQDPELIMEFIKNNIDYSNLPRLDKTIKVLVGVYNSNEDGKIDNVAIFRGYNDIFDKEALRVVKSIPEWDVLYRHGKKIQGTSWMIPVIFELRSFAHH